MMIIEIDNHSGVPIYTQVIEQIKQYILSGNLSEGSQLENVRGLAARLMVNPMTISKAYNQLERDGIIERRRGIGMFVKPMSKGIKKDVKSQTAKESFKKAASTAIRMDYTEEEAVDLLRQIYRKLKNEQGEDKDE
ncbi:MAG: GntR family transcriptional regulator [Deltaproteobacteria bacterium]|nr:GntR family transcriptional regulator [Deltaproteobacteria bacterium]